MNAGAVATAAAVRDAQDVEGGCFHCSEALPAVPATARIDGAPRRFCCDGCAAAAQWIRDAHLVDYYRLRSEPGGRIADLDAQLAAFDRDDIQSGHVRDVDGGVTTEGASDVVGDQDRIALGDTRSRFAGHPNIAPRPVMH